MTLPRAYDLLGAWDKVPPVHWMVAAKLGYGKKQEEAAKTAAEHEAGWDELAAAMGTTLQRNKQNVPES